MTRLVAAGDSALVLAFEERIDPEVSARVVAAAAHLRRHQPAGVRDVVPAYCSVTVYFDPLRVDHDRLAALAREAGALDPATRVEPEREVRVPVCYGGDFGPDLREVARFAGVDEPGVVARHSGRRYHVFMLGFVPGFAYMGVVDATIAAPRRATPRSRVPAGSVGIAGRQTGIYPRETPGGWQLIGRTPVRPFEAGRAEPCLLAPGDAVRFEPIDRETFDRLAGEGR